MPRMSRAETPNVSVSDHRGSDEQKNDRVEIINAGSEPEEVGLDPVDDVSRAVMKGSAVPGNGPKKGPDVRRYLVVRGGQILSNGMRTMLKEGKIIDALNYDVKKLQQQGIRLQRYVEEELPWVE